ncbi:uncharacterized protein [Henckelia pumila]|uniref:uncharacterized protein n=1 Tax=Henckelia pumila TaxID=405737 RepID=UPI003C6DCC2A
MEAVDSFRKHKENRKKRKEETEMGNSLPAQTVRESNGGNKSCKQNKKREMDKKMKSGREEKDTPNSNAIEGRIYGKKDAANEAKDKLQNSSQKKRKNIERVKRADAVEAENVVEQQNGKPKISAKKKKKRRSLGTSQDDFLEKKGSLGTSQDDFLEKKGNVADFEVDQMSSGDEDYSKGMRKWVIQYHQSRPGIKVLQERIDDFITAHEAQEEQARKEREAQAAEGGWTVVVHHKGRKKTTDAESGTAVGSVAQAAVLDKMAKKKRKEVGLEFYRFQRREARRNEIMMLQSKFEQDKKRIQEMRAARKFRPY